MKKIFVFFLIFMIFSVSVFADTSLNADILEAIKNSTSYDDTESIIKENSSDIGIDSSTYDDLTSEEKEEVMEEITGSEFGSLDDLKNKFNELVADKTECIIEATLKKSDSYYMGTVKIHNLSGSAVLSIAKYKDGKLVSLETREYINDTENFDVYENTDTVKIMLWSSISSLKPLCEAEHFSVTSLDF